MGQKVHPYGFRLGIIRQARSTWFAEGKQYSDQLLGDLKIRRHIDDTQSNANVSDVHIERAADTVIVTIKTAKPGIVIGRGGRDVEVLRRRLEKIAGQRVRVNVEETKEPDINAVLVAQNIARQIERRVSYRRALRQAIDRAMKQGAKGIRCMVSGRLQGADIARTEAMGPEGRVPLHTLRADVEYGFAEASTGYGHIGVKVWIYKGDILPPRKIKPGDLYVPDEEGAEQATDDAGTGEGETPEAAAAAQPTPEAAPAAPVAAEATPAAPAATETAPAAAESPAEPVAEAAAPTADQAEAPAVEEAEAIDDPQDAVIVAEAIEDGEAPQQC